MTRRHEHRRALQPGGLPIEVIRSTRRRRGATAFERDGRIVVQLPAALPAVEAEHTIATLVRRVSGQARAAARGGDEWLHERACALGRRWLDGVTPTATRWSSRMARRWASATPSTGEIRVSSRAAGFPDKVVDHLLVHELAHLVVPDHSSRFHELLARHPDGDWARGFLAGVAHAAVAPGPGATDRDPSTS